MIGYAILGGHAMLSSALLYKIYTARFMFRASVGERQYNREAKHLTRTTKTIATMLCGGSCWIGWYILQRPTSPLHTILGISAAAFWGIALANAQLK